MNSKVPLAKSFDSSDFYQMCEKCVEVFVTHQIFIDSQHHRIFRPEMAPETI